MQTEMGIGIIGDDQTDITPFQRQVFEAEQNRKAEEKQKRMDGVNGGGGGRQKNSMSGGATSSRQETIRYESEDEREDDVLEVIE